VKDLARIGTSLGLVEGLERAGFLPIRARSFHGLKAVRDDALD